MKTFYWIFDESSCTIRVYKIEEEVPRLILRDEPVVHAFGLQVVKSALIRRGFLSLGDKARLFEL